MQLQKLTAGIEAPVVRAQGRRALVITGPATIVLALVLAGLALGEVNGLLRGMHGSGHPGYGAQDVVDVLHPWETEARADRVAASWSSYEDTIQGSARPQPGSLVWYFVLIDSVAFAPAYAVAAWLMLGRFTPGGADEKARRRARLARIAQRVVPFALAFDWAENVLVRVAASDALADGDVGTGIALGVWVPSAAKTTAIALFLVPLGALVVAALRDVFRARQRNEPAEADKLTPRLVLRRLRIHLLLVVVFGAVLLGHEQLPDLVRRWSPLQGLVTVAFTSVLALTVWLTARWLVRSAKESELLTTKNAWLSYAVPLGILGAGLALWLVGLGWGLTVPGVILSAAAVLSLLSSRRAKATDEASASIDPEPPARGVARATPTDDQSGDADSVGNRVARALAAATLVLLGVGVFHASFAQAILYGSFGLRSLLPLAVFVAGLLVGWYLGLRFRPRRLLAIVVTEPLLLGFAGLSAYVVLFEPRRSDTDPWLQTVLAGLLTLSGWWLYHRLASVPPLTRRTYRGGLSTLAIAALTLAVLVVSWPHETASELGGAAVLAGFLTLLALLGTLAVRVNDGVPAPPSLAALEIKHIPLLTILLAWFILASVLDKSGYHNIRRDLRQPARGVSLERAWSCWLERNGLDSTGLEPCGKTAGPPPDPATGPVPLLLVATSGGGARAAYWTAAVLDCAFESSGPDCDDASSRVTGFDRSDRLFAVSGISGGSVGLASYAALLAEREQVGSDRSSDPLWFEQRMSGDALSASVAWWLYVESAQSLLRFTGTRDRAAILEQGWERDWRDNGGGGGLERGLFATWWGTSHAPLLLLNGTSVKDGCRFEVSPLDANVEAGDTLAERIEQCRSSRAFDEDPSRQSPEGAALVATRDLADYVCPDSGDIRLSTAALLSARFPFVSPSGRIPACDDDRIVSYVVDGGYLDTSGASPLVELMDRLGPLIDDYNRQPLPQCVVPFLVQIDNGPPPGASEGTRRPLELNVPLTTLFETRLARAANARNGAALLFNTDFPAASLETPDGATALDDRYAHFFNLDAPGPRPPLGWVMSSFSREELRQDRLRGPNPDAFAEVRAWLGDDPERRLACR